MSDNNIWYNWEAVKMYEKFENDRTELFREKMCATEALLDRSPSTSDLKRNPSVFSVLPPPHITLKSYPDDSEECGETV